MFRRHIGERRGRGDELRATLSTAGAAGGDPLVPRRTLLRCGVSGGAAIVLAACAGETPVAPGPVESLTIDVRRDPGALAVLHVLAQVQVAVFRQAEQSASGSDLSPAEQGVITDLRYHATIHREALARLLGAAAPPAVGTTLRSVDFGKRTSVLAAARTLADAAAAASNGLAAVLADPSNLLLAAKIGAVSARHAAVVRDLLNPGSRDFAGDDVVDASGLGPALDPAAVVAVLAPFLTTTVTVRTA